jgi:hypothetical protein
MVNLNVDLDDAIVGEVEALLWKYVFAWSSKELIEIPHTLFSIELNSTPHSHQLIRLGIKWILTMLQWLNKIWINYSQLDLFH